MAVNPRVSYEQIDALQTSPYVRTVVIVGQSNTATAGLYKDIEYDDIQTIETKFGKSSHLGRALQDATTMLSGFVKPKIWAVSYADKSAAVARVLETTVTGTATRSYTQKIRIHSLDPFNASVQVATAHAMRETDGCNCSSVWHNSAVTKGIPAAAVSNFNAPLSKIKTNDVIVEVAITKGDTATQVATKITTAITANEYSIYSAANTAGVLTLTSKHKGEISQFFVVEFVANASTTGLTFTTVEDIAGSDAVDISAMLTSVKDSDNTPLGELDFDYIVVPYSYSVTNLVEDAYAKWSNVTNYGNRCLDYIIIQGTAIDLSDNTELDILTDDNAIEESGLVRHLCVLSRDDLIIRPVSYTKTALIESRQFTPIQKEFDGSISVGNSYTLSSKTGFVDLNRVLGAGMTRYLEVELRIPTIYPEMLYSPGTAVQPFIMTAERSIAESKLTRDIADGTVLNSIFGNRFAGLISNDPDARSEFDEFIEASTGFDVTTKTLFMTRTQYLLNALQNISITTYNK